MKNFQWSNPQKSRKGFTRLYFALLYSLRGLRDAFAEKAFQLEVVLALFLMPSAFWIGQSWSEKSLLIASIFLVLILEIVNTGLESVVDRIGLEHHELSRRCKDLGSAAVLLGIFVAIFIWLSAMYYFINGK
jgi:diacylglycerol kinase (ATP)